MSSRGNRTRLGWAGTDVVSAMRAVVSSRLAAILEVMARVRVYGLNLDVDISQSGAESNKSFVPRPFRPTAHLSTPWTHTHTPTTLKELKAADIGVTMELTMKV